MHVMVDCVKPQDNNTELGKRVKPEQVGTHTVGGGGLLLTNPLLFPGS